MAISTIRDVARAAGVSVTTVSRVMNERPDVSPSTRKRVLEAIEACRFVVNPNARSLKRADARIAAIIVRGRQNIFLNDVTERMLQFAAQSDVNFLTEYIDESDDEFLTARRIAAEKHATGFILLGSRIDERSRAVQGLDAAFVFATVDARGSDMPSASSVCVDDQAMAREAVAYLLSGGHRKIAVFGGRRILGDNLSLRYLGAKDAFSDAGLAFDEDLYAETRFSLAGARACAQTFFEGHPEVTAAFCMSDLVALGVIRALRETGRRVPEDVSVVGFDGIELGRYTSPTLATVRQNPEEIAQRSVGVLLDMMDGSPARWEIAPAAFLPGESAAPRS